MKRNLSDTLILKCIVFGGTLFGLVWITGSIPSTPFPYRMTTNQKIPPSAPHLPRDMIVPVFRDHTLSSGLIFEYRQRAGKSLTGLDEVTGGGACVLDFDQDGWMDLFLVNGSGQTYFYGRQLWWQKAQGHRLYRNSGNAQFEDVTEASGIVQQAQGIGCVSGDLDNDGASDLFVTHKGANTLYRNNGDGTFSDVTVNSGITGNHWSTSAVLADYDRDGYLDIYVVNYLRYYKGAHTFEQNSSFIDPLAPAFNPTLYDSASNRLYRNLGQWKFEDVTTRAGVENVTGRGLAALWLDVNHDQLPDLFVSNDKGSPNVLFINQGEKKFQETPVEAQVNTVSGSRGVVSGDIDNDGDPDLLLSSAEGFLPVLLINKTEKAFGSQINPQARWFEDQARTRNLGTEEVLGFSGWGAGLHDFNNDGWLDAFMGNGLRVPSLDTPAFSQGQGKLLWLNLGEGKFRLIQNGLVLKDIVSSRGSVFADFDNDGAIDIYVVNNNDFGQLLLNQAPSGHWLGLQLQSGQTNRDAVGAKVWLSSLKGWQFRELQRGNGSFSASDPRLHFGLGKDEKIAELKIRWSDGSTQSFQNLPINRYLRFTQGMKEWEVLVSSKVQKNTSTQMATALKQTQSKFIQEIIHSIKTLEDPEPSNRVVAINALKEYEAQESVRWLLRVFNDSNPEVLCALAEAFAFFYREEEAMVFRKHLAIPHLLRMLQDEIPQSRICAIQALGDAENYRSLKALIDAISDPVDQVRVQAVRALGLIREQQALPAIRKIVNDAHASAALKAHALIALKRLNAPDLSLLFTSLFPIRLQTKQDQQQAHVALEAFQILFSDHTDGIVINYNQLAQTLITWLKDKRSDFDFPLPLLHQSIEVLSQSGSRAAIVFLQSLLEHREVSVRLKSYQTLIRLDLSHQQDYIIQGLKDPSPQIKQAILQNQDPKRHALPIPVLLQALQTPQTQQLAIEHLAYFPNKQVQQTLWTILTNNQESAEIQLAALKSLTTLGMERNLPSQFFTAPDERIRAAAIRYWAGQRSKVQWEKELPETLARSLRDPSEIVKQAVVEILINENTLLPKRTLHQLLFTQKTSLALRIFILDKLSHPTRAEAVKINLRLTHWRHDPIHQEAIRFLSRFNDPQAEQMLWKILNNHRESKILRRIAAEALRPKYPERVRKILQSFN